MSFCGGSIKAVDRVASWSMITTQFCEVWLVMGNGVKGLGTGAFERIHSIATVSPAAWIELVLSVCECRIRIFALFRRQNSCLSTE